MSTVIVKTEIAEAVKFINGLGGSAKIFTGKALRAVGGKGVSAVKKEYKKTLKKRSGLLYKEVKSSLARDKMAVSVYSRAQREKVRYGFVLAAGSAARKIEARDWFQPPLERFMQSSEFLATVQKVLDKEVGRLVKK
jgi:hypothetical protein